MSLCQSGCASKPSWAKRTNYPFVAEEDGKRTCCGPHVIHQSELTDSLRVGHDESQGSSTYRIGGLSGAGNRIWLGENAGDFDVETPAVSLPDCYG